ncbi:MAG: hypothetical protein GC200_12340 [Tepidisphaera sp.]|nr:hypothetical protein [Tepidisphaera sp.]
MRAILATGLLVWASSSGVPLGALAPQRCDAMIAPDRGPEVDLRPKFKKGEEIRFTLNLDSSGKQVVPGTTDQTSSSTSQQIGLLLRVRDANPETGASLDLVYESFKMNVKAPTGDVSFDSSKPADKDDPTDQVLRSIVGLTLKVKVNADGDITSVEGGGDGLAGALAGQFTGADMIKGVFGPVFSVKPGKPKAAVGESWTTEDVLQGGAASTRVKMTHTLKSVQGSNANIDIKGTVTIDPSSGAMKAAVKESSVSGRAVWDIESGMLARLETDQKLTIETKGDKGSSLSTQTMNLRVVRQR